MLVASIITKKAVGIIEDFWLWIIFKIRRETKGYTRVWLKYWDMTALYSAFHLNRFDHWPCDFVVVQFFSEMTLGHIFRLITYYNAEPDEAWTCIQFIMNSAELHVYNVVVSTICNELCYSCGMNTAVGTPWLMNISSNHDVGDRAGICTVYRVQQLSTYMCSYMHGLIIGEGRTG